MDSFYPLRLLQQQAKIKRKENESFFAVLKTMPSAEVDPFFQEAFKQAQQTVDCGDCANCCRHLEAEWSEEEFKHLELPEERKKSAFHYVEEFKSWIQQKSPCLCLSGNRCSVYTQRPSACRSYPPLDGKDFKYRMERILEEYAVCPQVVFTVEKVKSQIEY